MTLLGTIVDRVGARRRRLDAEIVLQIVAGYEIADAPGGAAIFEARLKRIVAAAIHAEAAALLEGAALGRDVYDAGGAQAVLRGQRASNKLDVCRKARTERLAEAADSFGDDYAVDAVLQSVVLATNMDLAEGVLGDVGRLQKHLVEWVVLAARLRIDGFVRDVVGRGADTRFD